jgi:hypothetical protein
MDFNLEDMQHSDINMYIHMLIIVLITCKSNNILHLNNAMNIVIMLT